MARVKRIMGYTGELSHYLAPFINLWPHQIVAFMPYWSVTRFYPKTHILAPGEMEDYLSLIVQGAVRYYITGAHGRPLTARICETGEFVCDDTSFYLRTPSTITIQALENTVLLRLRYDKMQEVIDTKQWAEGLFGKILADVALRGEQADFTRRRYSDREHFFWLMQHKSSWVQRFSQVVLASYLDIAPSTFTRMRHLKRPLSTSAGVFQLRKPA